MNPFDHIVEQRIVEANARDEFADLPGAGRPLELDDDLLEPRYFAKIMARLGAGS